MTRNENETICSNEGCVRPAEEGAPLCAECSLEWSLFHRETRGDAPTSTAHPPGGDLVPIAPR